ncbi:hypothetical protein JCM33374_g2990 [Metschnikowia sp. JCM 33374]|nr:hypothetical protein JCM33374_g2990 [Metschnikowia sp. JCM 33374]
MNNPLAKYADTNTAKDLVFFNYHEYIVPKYAQLHPSNGSLDSNLNHSPRTTEDTEKPALVVTHFPNPYTDRKENGESTADLYWRTRIVRIPRIYDVCEQSYMVPQFSSYIPGREPAALNSEAVSSFDAVGSYKGYAFGVTSLTPLVPQWLSESEFLDIVITINGLLREATMPENKATWLESALDFFSGTLYSTVVTKFLRDSAFERNLNKVDEYVTSVNDKLREKHRDFRVIPLSQSAMLSLDFQIPMGPIKALHPNTDNSQSCMSLSGEQDKEPGD